MLRRVAPIEFKQAMGTGKTRPGLFVCEDAEEHPIEVVAKFSANTEAKEAALAREVIGACLAADLHLPITEPLLVEFPAGWENAIPDALMKTQVQTSNRVAFGSTLVVGQYSAWAPERKLTDAIAPTAAAVLVFDALIENPDRQIGPKPNCLVRGDEIRIIDHELAFPSLLIGGLRPWSIRGLEPLKGKHIFYKELRGRAIDFGPIKAAWQGLSDARIVEYGRMLPLEWTTANKDVNPVVAHALSNIKDARDKIDECLIEIQRVLQ